uniref:Uncharacterized protein n=1 Tax=viral metagenome TaxID=1070528 RepID=A0A6M3K6N7_9ZZZZ
MSNKKTNVGEILQQIYDSEIHLRIGWMWDGGLDYCIGSTSNDLWDSNWNKCEIVRTGNTNIQEEIIKLAEKLASDYPESGFGKWYNSI